MTFMKTIIKPLAHAALILWSLYSALVQAAPPAPEDLHTIRLKTTDAMTSFYMYNGLEADIKYANRIDLNLENVYAALVRVQNSAESEEEQALATTLTEAWNEFNRLMTDNRRDIVSRGYPDIRLVDEMGDACLKVDEAAAEYLSSNTTPSDKKEQTAQLIRDLSFQMANITAQYTARGTSNLGQVFVGYHKNTPSEMADRFDTLLSNLDNQVSERDQRTVRSIRSKWGFLRRSIENYNENSVPFLVLNYNDSIISSLTGLGEHYE